ncbi:MAG: hypothetical protein WDL87_08125 [Candidatus Omnitrophota bacterium]|jgi:hypothetical protein
MTLKTKSMEGLEHKMEGIDKDSLRYQILENVKSFKTSWVDLGQALYSVWKDKMYKQWGYSSFDIYTAKEIGIKKDTAMKLLRSYYFLEKEEPTYLKKEYAENTEAAAMPSYDTINVLRLAKEKKVLDDDDYADLKKDVFQKGKGAGEVKKDLTAMIRQRNELAPEEAREQRRTTTIKRFLSTLRSLKDELESAKMLSAPLLKEANDLIKQLELEVV